MADWDRLKKGFGWLPTYTTDAMLCCGGTDSDVSEVSSITGAFRPNNVWVLVCAPAQSCSRLNRPPKTYVICHWAEIHVPFNLQVFGNLLAAATTSYATKNMLDGCLRSVVYTYTRGGHSCSLTTWQRTL